MTRVRLQPRALGLESSIQPLNQCASFSSHSKRRPKIVFKTDYRLMQVKSIAECSKGSILQYFRPSLRYHLSLRSLFCLRYHLDLLFWPLKTGFTVSLKRFLTSKRSISTFFFFPLTHLSLENAASDQVLHCLLTERSMKIWIKMEFTNQQPLKRK